MNTKSQSYQIDGHIYEWKHKGSGELNAEDVILASVSKNPGMDGCLHHSFPQIFFVNLWQPEIWRSCE